MLHKGAGQGSAFRDFSVTPTVSFSWYSYITLLVCDFSEKKKKTAKYTINQIYCIEFSEYIKIKQYRKGDCVSKCHLIGYSGGMMQRTLEL